jgi:outer membrane protein insertion porin family
MDHKLPLPNAKFRKYRTDLRWQPVRKTYAAATVFLLIGVTSLGCQTGMMAGNGELPVPAAQLDPDQLQTVRYQSPGGRSRGAPAAGGLRRQPRDDVYAPDPWETLAPGANGEEIDQSKVIIDVIIQGNHVVPEHQILGMIQSRVGRYFDADKLQRDVDQLWRLPEVSRVNGPYINRTEVGIVLTFDIVERSVIREVKFIGNRGVSDRALRKKAGLDPGMPFNAHEIRMARARLEDLYKEKGFPRTQVELSKADGNDPSTVVFLIHEDQKQRVWNVEFEGNEIASDGRLKSFIESKPGIAKLIGGNVKRDEIEQDVLRLTNYYRSLGFFNARIGREVSESNDGKWVTIRFIIDEGPRYQIRNVSFIGNQSYRADQLLDLLELKPGEEGSPDFNSSKMNGDVKTLQTLYGSEGFVFATIQAEPRFLEEPGLLDVVYKIDEGEQYRVGQINVHFEGDYGITKREVVLSRLGLNPGDKIDANLIRKAENRLGSSQIFAARGTPGAQPPRIVVRPPELGGESSGAGSRTRVADHSSGSGTKRR